MRYPRLNKVLVSGNLIKDPELAYTRNNQSYCQFTVAHNTPRRVGDKWETDTSFFRATIWSEAAQRFVDKAKKGDYVLVDGILQQRSYEDRDGNKRESVTINAFKVDVCSRDEAQHENKATDNNQYPQPGTGADEDVPF